MEAREETRAPGRVAPGTERAAVLSVYERIDAEGSLAGIETLLSFSHEDVEVSAYAQTTASASEEERDVLRGKDAVRGFFERARERGFAMTPRAKHVTAEDDIVVVHGSIRVARPNGSFAETGVSWTFRFDDGLVREVRWQPRAGD